MTEPKSNHYFTDDDIKQILAVQGQTKADIAVAVNDLKWIIKTYTSQCNEITELQKTIIELDRKLDAVTNTVWKYAGFGAGVILVVELIFMALPYARGVT